MKGGIASGEQTRGTGELGRILNMFSTPDQELSFALRRRFSLPPCSRSLSLFLFLSPLRSAHVRTHALAPRPQTRPYSRSRSLEPQRLLPGPSPPHYKPSTPRRSLGHRRIPSVFDFACWIDARSRISTSFIRSFVRVVALCCTLVK